MYSPDTAHVNLDSQASYKKPFITSSLNLPCLAYRVNGVKGRIHRYYVSATPLRKYQRYYYWAEWRVLRKATRSFNCCEVRIPPKAGIS